MRSTHLALMSLVALVGCPPSIECGPGTEEVDGQCLPLDDTGDTADTADTGDTDVPIDYDYIVATGAPYVQVGSTVTVAATSYRNDISFTETYTWASSDDTVATVADGVVTGHYPGVVDITATGGTTGKTATVAMFVQNEIPFFDEWSGSAHALVTAEAFNHWNEDGEIATSCARCHSTPGYQDYIGADGTAAFVVDNPAPIGTVIECQACHNDATDDLDTVIFPSGVEITDLGPEARCMTCHQGRASTDSLEERIAGAAVGNDEVSASLGFTNIHYYPAGATLNAGRVRGGAQYEGETYDWRFRHVPGKDTCIGCHNQHSLELRIEECAECHDGVASVEDLKDVRMMASKHTDYDGDGNRTEGIYYELDGLRTQVLSAIQDYAHEQSAMSDICYNGGGYPYFFVDTDGNGTCDAADTTGYDTWTPRLMRAAYNYQMSVKDPGAFAHNAKYVIQLLHDSLQDVNSAMASPADLSALGRNDPGHFNGAGEPARHWDEDEAVSSGCARCHGGAEGFRFYLEYGVGISDAEPDNGLDCATCHDSFGDEYAVVQPASVTWPDGSSGDVGGISNLCGTCHSGRENKATVDARIASGSFGFRNVHYLPAAATRMGSAAHGGYEYDGNTYAGKASGHVGGDACTDCHDPVASEHTFQVDDVFGTVCTTCHRGATDPHDIRASKYTADYDGDGSNTEPMADELHGLADALYAEIQAYTSNGICYNGDRYPYFFADSNADGDCAGETGSYKSWDAALMKATFNYQYYNKEHGAWAHNFSYVAQLLIDSTADLGGDVSGLTRP